MASKISHIKCIYYAVLLMNTNGQDAVCKYQWLKWATLKNVASWNFTEVKIKVSERLSDSDPTHNYGYMKFCLTGCTDHIKRQSDYKWQSHYVMF